MNTYFCVMRLKSHLMTLPYLQQGGFFLLLVLYSLAAFKVDSFHEVFHAGELAELHSPEQESNPCHKSIYHQTAEQGCAHKSHITENTKCPLCECNLAIDQLVHETPDSRPILVTSEQHSFYAYPAAKLLPCKHAGRGPPKAV